MTDGLAIYDTMQYVRPDVSTICVGLAASMGQFLLCAGAPGKRFALPHSRILMHQPSGAMQGQAADIAIQAEQIIYLKRMMAERIAFHTGQPARAHRDGLGPRPLVHRRRGARVRLHRPGHRPFRRRGRKRLNVALDVPASPSGAKPPADGGEHEGYGLARPVADASPMAAEAAGFTAREARGHKVTRVVSPTISVGSASARSGSPASCWSTWCAPRSR